MNTVETLLRLAEEELVTAELLLNNDRYRACLSRTYYAMYYATQALLNSRHIHTSTHKGLIKLFGLHFIKTGDLPVELSIQLSNAYDLRQLADYGESASLTYSQVQTMLQNAQDFIEQVRTYLARI